MMRRIRFLTLDQLSHLLSERYITQVKHYNASMPFPYGGQTQYSQLFKYHLSDKTERKIKELPISVNLFHYLVLREFSFEHSDFKWLCCRIFAC